MPPEKIYWPKTRDEMDARIAEAREKFLPALRRLQLFELLGMNEALGVALEEIKPLAYAEDVRRGDRPAGTRIGR